MLFVVFIWPPRIRCEDRGSVQLHYGHSSYGRNRYTPEWGDGKGSAPTEPGSTGLIQERSFRGRSSGLAVDPWFGQAVSTGLPSSSPCPHASGPFGRVGQSAPGGRWRG